MWRTVFRIFALSVIVSAATAEPAAGDPVVLRNGSVVSGELSLGPASSGFHTFYLSSESLPPSGVGTLQDGRVLHVGDTQLTSSAELTTSISPLTFSATGGITVSTQQPPDSTSAGLRLNAQAVSQLVIEFTLAEARAFTYTGRYFGRLDESSNGIPPGVLGPFAGGTLYRVFNIDPNTTATVTYVRDNFFSLYTEQLTQHSGILDPGRYFFQANSIDRLEQPNTRLSAGYEVSLSFAAEPVPEPATLLLATSGLTAVLAVARRRRRDVKSRSPA